MGTRGTIQWMLQVIKPDLNIGRGRGRHCIRVRRLGKEKELGIAKMNHRATGFLNRNYTGIGPWRGKEGRTKEYLSTQYPYP